MNVYENLKKCGIDLVPGPKPLGLYHTASISGNILYTSGTGCRKDGAPLFAGKVGDTVTFEQAQACARQCVINILCNLQTELGDLNRIKKVVKVLGFIASADTFYDQPKVLNGASEILHDIFGDAGIGARSAIGVRSLPGNIPAEIEIIFELNN